MRTDGKFDKLTELKKLIRAFRKILRARIKIGGLFLGWLYVSNGKKKFKRTLRLEINHSQFVPNSKHALYGLDKVSANVMGLKGKNHCLFWKKTQIHSLD
jgi:hypothetical protein